MLNKVILGLFLFSIYTLIYSCSAKHATEPVIVPVEDLNQSLDNGHDSGENEDAEKSDDQKATARKEEKDNLHYEDFMKDMQDRIVKSIKENDGQNASILEFVDFKDDIKKIIKDTLENNFTFPDKIKCERESDDSTLRPKDIQKAIIDAFKNNLEFLKKIKCEGESDCSVLELENIQMAIKDVLENNFKFPDKIKCERESDDYTLKLEDIKKVIIDVFENNIRFLDKKEDERYGEATTLSLEDIRRIIIDTFEKNITIPENKTPTNEVENDKVKSICTSLMKKLQEEAAAVEHTSLLINEKGHKYIEDNCLEYFLKWEFEYSKPVNNGDNL